MIIVLHNFGSFLPTQCLNCPDDSHIFKPLSAFIYTKPPVKGGIELMDERDRGSRSEYLPKRHVMLLTLCLGFVNPITLMNLGCAHTLLGKNAYAHASDDRGSLLRWDSKEHDALKNERAD